MFFHETEIEGVWVVEPERHEDERGFFARTWDRREFEERGLSAALAQCSVSFNRRRLTLRGLHYQAAPYEEAKLVRCTAGAIFDVAVDLRPESPTFRRWVGRELSADNHLALFMSEGHAHGFLTLEDATEVEYAITQVHVLEASRGVRWDDPAFGIDWPADPLVMNERDRSYADFAPERDVVR